MNQPVYHTKCLCCGSAAISKVFECRDYTVSQELFEVWKCSSCTFRFTQNAPAEEHIGKYYQSADYVSHSDTKQGLVNRLYHIVRNFTLKSKCRLVKKAVGLKHGNLLDIGAGTGAFANTMTAAGWHVTGLEPDGTARQKASELYNLQLKELKELKHLQEEAYDAITLWHVLEHVHDLQGYLNTFYQLLKPAGRLIIAVPNYTSYDAQVYRQHWAAYDVPRHLYHFSPQSMEVLLNKHQFRLQAIRPMWFDSFYVSMLSEKYRHGRNNMVKASWTGMLSNAKTLFNKKKCSSVIYIISKQ